MTAEDLLAEVSDPSTLPERLERLWFGFPYPHQKPGYQRSHEIRRRIAAHPNLTPKLVGRALGKYPEVVCASPVFSLLLLETPDIMKRVPPTDMLAWLKREHCPRPFVELMTHKNWLLISEAAKRHVSYAGYVSRDELPEVLRAELIEMPRAKDDKSLKALHDVGLVPQSISDHFGLGEPTPLHDWSEDAFVVDVAEEPLTEEEERELRVDLWPTDDQQKDTLGFNNWLQLTAICSYERTRPAVLRHITQLSSQCWGGLTYYLSRNPATPIDVLLKLLKEGKADIGLPERLEELPQLPAWARRQLAAFRHYDRDITRLASLLALANSTTVKGWDRRLAKAVNWRRRLGLALNPLTPPDLLELLAHDGNRLVNAAAKAQLETPGIRLLELL